jgi:hypothetical protein
MSSEMRIIFGIVGALINAASLVPYVRDIIRHKTKPQRSMWWIYSGLFLLLFAAQLDAGSGWVVVLTAEYVLSATTIAILSLKYGYGSLHKRDGLSIGVALFGLAAWLITSNPLLAIIMVVMVDFAGFWLTIVKTWHAPHSETLISWELSLIGNIIGVAAVTTWSFTVLVYPVYAVLGTALLDWIIIYRRRKIAVDPIDY